MGIFDETQIEKVKVDTLTSQELMKDFCRVMKQFLIRVARVIKGSFDPSFAGLAIKKNTLNSSKSKNLENEKSDSKKKKNSKC